MDRIGKGDNLHIFDLFCQYLKLVIFMQKCVHLLISKVLILLSMILE
jgi:hypothetical protein